MAAICSVLLLRWEKERSSPVGSFPHRWDGICLRQTHTHALIKTRTPFYLSSWRLAPCCAMRQLTRWWAEGWCGSPSPPAPRAPGPCWEVKSLNDTLKLGQGDERYGVKGRPSAHGVTFPNTPGRWIGCRMMICPPHLSLIYLPSQFFSSSLSLPLSSVYTPLNTSWDVKVVLNFISLLLLLFSVSKIICFSGAEIDSLFITM